MARFGLALVWLASIAACGNQLEQVKDFADTPSLNKPTQAPASNPERNVYFGDLHTHTRYSFDAYLLGNEVTPDETYRYAKGEMVRNSFGLEMKLSEPLDFFAVTDHAIFLGVVPEWADPDSRLGQLPGSKPFHGVNEGDMLNTYSAQERVKLFRSEFGRRAFTPGSWWDALTSKMNKHPASTSKFFDDDAHQAAWLDIVGAAQRHNQPGEFTTFIGYEWTSSTAAPESAAYHRNVIFSGSKAPARPFSRFDSIHPEDLWGWMEEMRESGLESLAIPHNSNQSNGQVFRTNYSDGRPIDQAFADLRMRNEMLVEITQVKGTSETHPMLSPEDEWADFEVLNTRKGKVTQFSNPHGSYVRQALAHGIALDQEGRGNPFKVGFIGSTDNHNGASSVEEDGYFGSTPLSGSAENRGSVPASEERLAHLATLKQGPHTQTSSEAGGEYFGMRNAQFSASGLAAVWAEENTRESLFAAFKRRETYATSGPRIRLRFFGGFGLENLQGSDASLLKLAYEHGVPMGSDLLGQKDGQGETAPQFLVWAQRDSRSASLQRVQIIKVWYDGSYRRELREQVYDVACAGGAAVDPETNRCPDNGATVDVATCVTSGVGAQEIRATWTDPEFDPEVGAAYYARVLENPTCRWTTWDAVRAGVPPREGIPTTIQERAWSSPIWFDPNATSGGAN